VALLRQCLAELRSKYADAEDWVVSPPREGAALRCPIASQSQSHRDGVLYIERYRQSVLVANDDISANGGQDA
jgi:hypothetical protein